MELKLTKENGKVKLSDTKGNVLGWLPMDADERRQKAFADIIMRFMKGEEGIPPEPERAQTNPSNPNHGVRYNNGVISVDEETLVSGIKSVSSFLSGLSRKP